MVWEQFSTNKNSKQLCICCQKKKLNIKSTKQYLSFLTMGGEIGHSQELYHLPKGTFSWTLLIFPDTFTSNLLVLEGQLTFVYCSSLRGISCQAP